MIPLDRNESYWMLDEALVEAVRLGARDLSTYPDYGELKKSLALYAGVIPEQILVTPGSDSAIEHIARAYAGNGGEVILPVPTFYGYESILERVGAKTIPITYEERDGHFVFPLAKTLEALANGSAKILFLCHPNNPLGCPLSPEDISALTVAAKGSNTLIVSDEAYFEFSSGTTFLPSLSDLPQLVVIRTLSKAFALSGARIGYAIASPEIVKKIEKCMLPWPAAHLSVTASLALLSRASEVKERRDLVMTTRDSFIQTLRTFKEISVYDSETNFVLIRVPDATLVRDTLLSEGIRVVLGEPMSHFPEAKMLLQNTVRIAIPSPDDSAQVIAVLSSLFTT